MADNAACLFHGGELSFSYSEFSRIQSASFGENRRARVGKNVMTNQLWRGVEAVKPSDWRTSGNSLRRSETHCGVERKAAWKDEVGDGWDVGRSILQPLIELSENTFFLLTLTFRSWCRRKSAPRIGTDTGANWNVQEQFHVPKRSSGPGAGYSWSISCD